MVDDSHRLILFDSGVVLGQDLFLEWQLTKERGIGCFLLINSLWLLHGSSKSLYSMPFAKTLLHPGAAHGAIKV